MAIGTTMAIALGAAAAFGGKKVADKVAKKPAAPNALAPPPPTVDQQSPHIQGDVAGLRARLRAQAGRQPSRTLLGAGNTRSSWDRTTLGRY